MTGIDRRRLLALGAGVVGGAATGNLLVSAPAGAAVSDIVDCGTWGARAPSTPIVLGDRPHKIIVHHMASPNTTDLSQAHAYALARSSQRDHMDRRGWIDTGQHFTNTRGAWVLEGRHRSLEALRGGTRHVIGAHCTGQNAYAVGIENEGTYTSELPPGPQYAALIELCVTICRAYAIRPYAIYGHRDFQNTRCPGDAFWPRLWLLRRDVAAQVGGDPYLPPWPVLRRGAASESVRTLQHLLRQAGQTPTADGVFGAGTEAAVRAFQTERDSAIDGVAGRQTWNHLADPVRTGARGEAVTGAQHQLVARGADLAIDGVFGPATAAAVQAFQRQRGLPADGVVDARTWNHLVG